MNDYNDENISLGSSMIPSILSISLFSTDGLLSVNCLAPSIVEYLSRRVHNTPWSDHLLLAAIVLTLQQNRSNAIQRTIHRLHLGFRVLKSYYGLTEMDDWEPEPFIHLMYVSTEPIVCRIRNPFTISYIAVTEQVQQYIADLPPTLQHRYRDLVLPVVNPVIIDEYIKSEIKI